MSPSNSPSESSTPIAASNAVPMLSVITPPLRRKRRHQGRLRTSENLKRSRFLLTIVATTAGHSTTPYVVKAYTTSFVHRDLSGAKAPTSSAEFSRQFSRRKEKGT